MTEITLEQSLFYERQYVAEHPVYFRRYPHQQCKRCGHWATWTGAYWVTYGTNDVNCLDQEAGLHRMLTPAEERNFDMTFRAIQRQKAATIGIGAIAAALFLDGRRARHNQPGSGGADLLNKAQWGDKNQ